MRVVVSAAASFYAAVALSVEDQYISTSGNSYHPAILDIDPAYNSYHHTALDIALGDGSICRGLTSI